MVEKWQIMKSEVLGSERLPNCTVKTCKILFTLLIGHRRANFGHARTGTVKHWGGRRRSPVSHHTPGTRPAPPAPLLHAIDAVPYCSISWTTSIKSSVAEKKTKFSQSPAERELHSTLLALEIGTKLSRTSCGKHYFKAAELQFPAFSHHKEGFLDWNVKEFLKQHLG